MHNELISPQDIAKLQGSLLRNELLAKYTSWGVGGPAEYLYLPQNLEDLTGFLALLPETVAVTWLGAGTNVLVRDTGIRGVVIAYSNNYQTRANANNIATVQPNVVCAGTQVLSAQLAKYVADVGFSGLEFLIGIPGTIGGALAMNAGAYGSTIWDYVTEVLTINRFGKRFRRKLDEFTISYREIKCKSSPKETAPEWFIASYFTLRKAEKAAGLKLMQEYLARRRKSQPLDLPNAGCVFRNPPGEYAARLIELCGLKGYRIGGACVSHKHANFIVNDQHATAQDIEMLLHHVAMVVKKQTGIDLQREVKILG